VSAALIIQHAMRMRRIILLSVACLALTNFSTSHKRHDFGGEKLSNIKCVLNFPKTFARNIFHSKKNSVSEILSCLYIRTPLIRKLVTLIANYPDRLVPSGKHFLTVIVLHIFTA